ncbi:MAG: hypothetical protein JXB85_00935 [Anaerolineales bacterium]|nr:hypothetical protein [Anaerolineales bacterium]
MIPKTCSMIISALARGLCALLLAALLAPFVFFAWQITRPMGMPEFHGLSYLQFLADTGRGMISLQIPTRPAIRM